MNREIKFRAWDGYNINYDLYEQHGYNGNIEINDCLAYIDNLMQYTGLKDKNGVEIYEGDILSLSRCSQNEYKVGFIEGAFCLCFINGIWKNHYALDMNYIQRSLKKKSEVIGNIYENPELVDNSD